MKREIKILVSFKSWDVFASHQIFHVFKCFQGFVEVSRKNIPDGDIQEKLMMFQTNHHFKTLLEHIQGDGLHHSSFQDRVLAWCKIKKMTMSPKHLERTVAQIKQEFNSCPVQLENETGSNSKNSFPVQIKQEIEFVSCNWTFNKCFWMPMSVFASAFHSVDDVWKTVHRWTRQ